MNLLLGVMVTAGGVLVWLLIVTIKDIRSDAAIDRQLLLKRRWRKDP